MGEVGGHQHRVPGGEGAGFAVTHAGVHQVGAFARAAAVAADGHVEGWRVERERVISWVIKRPLVAGKGHSPRTAA